MWRIFPAYPGALLSHLLSTNYNVCFDSFQRQCESSLTKHRSFAEYHTIRVSAATLAASEVALASISRYHAALTKPAPLVDVHSAVFTAALEALLRNNVSVHVPTVFLRPPLDTLLGRAGGWQRGEGCRVAADAAPRLRPR